MIKYKIKKGKNKKKYNKKKTKIIVIIIKLFIIWRRCYSVENVMS